MGADVAARLPSANKRHPSVVLSNPPAAGAAWFTLFVGTPQAREQSY